MIRNEVMKGIPLGMYDIIDAHAHIGPVASYFNPETTPKGIINLMDMTGIKVICASGMDCMNNDIPGGNERLYRAMEEFPGRILGYCTVNPWDTEEMKAELKKCLAMPGIIGIKIHPSAHEYSVTGRNYDIVWEYAQENGFIVLSHTWANGPYCQPEAFGDILAGYPGMTLLLGHSGGLYNGYEQCIRLVNKFPNAYMELCGCEFSSVWIEDVLKFASCDRIVFGTDQVFHDPRYLLGRIVLAEIPEEAKLAILGGNMKRILASKGRCLGNNGNKKY